MNQQSAFPFGAISETTGQPINGCFSEGMTLRDYFAAKALQGLFSESSHPHSMGITDFELVASQSYKVADAMMQARLS